ncbi:MAG: hypothetical protein ACAI35_23205 [Candidatus Methylacidiphilales bacterium]|nr:hypothetical protein [Candidatus Methylacidiphilales bacterium]
MKSAYELAMERLEKASPTQQLTPEQLERIREIDSLYQSKIAERDVFLTGEVAKAQSRNDWAEAQQYQQQLARDTRTLREECEEKKERVRQGKS